MPKLLLSAAAFLSLVMIVGVLSVCTAAPAKSPDANTQEPHPISGTSRAPKLKLTRTQGSDRHQTVRSGLQDKGGNLWFATTAEGVYCYDGKGFTQYTIRDGLNSNTVWSILEDKKGRIWFGTAAGLSRWDGKSIRNVPISIASDLSAPAIPIPGQTAPAQATVWSMLEDKKGTIWIGTSEGMFCEKDGIFSRFLEDGKVQNASRLHLKMVDAILEDRRGNLWFASGMPPGMEGLCRFDGTSVTPFKPGGEGWIRSVSEDREGNLWLGTRSKGVWRYDGKTFSRYSEQAGLGMPALVDRLGNIWFCGEGHENGFESKTGIWRYNGKTFRNFSKMDGMENFEAWCIVEDRDNNIWVGTRNTSLYRYDGKSFICLSE
jgi:ligand-binding sensor domain-containing protein